MKHLLSLLIIGLLTSSCNLPGTLEEMEKNHKYHGKDHKFSWETEDAEISSEADGGTNPQTNGDEHEGSD